MHMADSVIELVTRLIMITLIYVMILTSALTLGLITLSNGLYNITTPLQVLEIEKHNREAGIDSKSHKDMYSDERSKNIKYGETSVIYGAVDTVDASTKPVTQISGDKAHEYSLKVRTNTVTGTPDKQGYNYDPVEYNQ